MKKRILSILLAMLMVLSSFASLTITSFAADDSNACVVDGINFTTVQGAFNALAVDGVERHMTLLKDVVIDVTNAPLVIPAGKIVILDLNGHTLDCQISGTGNQTAISIESTADLTIMDSTDTDRDGTGDGSVSMSLMPRANNTNWSTIYPAIKNMLVWEMKFDLVYDYITNNGQTHTGINNLHTAIDTYLATKYDAEDLAKISDDNLMNLVEEVLEDKLSTNTLASSSADNLVTALNTLMTDNLDAITNQTITDTIRTKLTKIVNITMDGHYKNYCVWTASKYDDYGGWATNYISSYGNLTLESGAIYNTVSGSACYGVDVYGAGKLYVNGGRIQTCYASSIRIFGGDGQYVEINGGYIGDPTYSATYAIQPWYTLNPTIVINAGTFYSQYSFYQSKYSTGGNVNAGSTTSITINGGTFNGRVGTGTGATPEFVINGGTFHNLVTFNTFSTNYQINGGNFDGGYVYTWNANNGTFINGNIFCGYGVCYYGRQFTVSGHNFSNNMDPDTKDAYPFVLGESRVWFNSDAEKMWIPEWYNVGDEVDLNQDFSTLYNYKYFDKRPLEKEGYRLVGWTLDPSSDVPLESITYTGGELNLYAIWKREYAVIFDKNGAEGDLTDSYQTKYIANEDIVFPSGAGLTKDGYTFVGWNTDKDANFGLMGDSMNEAEKTFYAIWVPNDQYSSNVSVTVNTNENPAAVPTQESLDNLKSGVEETAPEDTDVLITCEEVANASDLESAVEIVELGLNDGQEKIYESASEVYTKAVDVKYLDLNVIRTAGGVSTKITNTGDKIIEFIVDFDLGNSVGLSLYRYHDGEVTEFKRTEATGVHSDLTYYYDKTNKQIHFFANKFSDYAIKTEDCPVDVKDAKYYASLTLNNSIDINFLLKGCNFTSEKLAKLKVYCNDKEVTTKLSAGNVDATLISFAPEKMNNTIHVKVVYDNVVVKEYDYSVRRYCDSAIATNTNSKLVDLCYATIGYGVAAENWFYSDDPIDETESVGYGIDTVKMSAALKKFATEPSDYTSDDPAYDEDKIVSAQGQLVTGSKLSLVFYVKTYEKYDLDKFVVFNSDNLRVTDDNMTVSYDLDTHMYTIVVKNISADRILKSYTLKIKGVNDFAVPFSVCDYCYEMTANYDYWYDYYMEEYGLDITGANDYVSAIYVYGQAATAYSNK